jgi:hypothetical protein
MRREEQPNQGAPTHVNLLSPFRLATPTPTLPCLHDLAAHSTISVRAPCRDWKTRAIAKTHPSAVGSARMIRGSTSQNVLVREHVSSHRYDACSQRTGTGR